MLVNTAPGFQTGLSVTLSPLRQPDRQAHKQAARHPCRQPTAQQTAQQTGRGLTSPCVTAEEGTSWKSKATITRILSLFSQTLLVLAFIITPSSHTLFGDYRRFSLSLLLCPFFLLISRTNFSFTIFFPVSVTSLLLLFSSDSFSCFSFSGSSSCSAFLPSPFQPL